MIYLILATLSSTSIIVTFRVFKKFDISIVQAITVNYLVACCFGYLTEMGSFGFIEIPEKPWFSSAIIVGVALIGTFYLFALSAQYAGVTITAISSRMSVIIPVLLGFVLFHDTLNIIKVLGCWGYF